VQRHKLEHIWHDEEGSAWLERFPDELVRLLAMLEAPDSIAALWVQHEEIGHDVNDLVGVLNDLKRLAQLAQTSQKSLYLWGSL
jgi:predicted metalloprotease